MQTSPLKVKVQNMLQGLMLVSFHLKKTQGGSSNQLGDSIQRLFIREFGVCFHLLSGTWNVSC